MEVNEEIKIVVPEKQMYRQSGNSIVVNVLEAILKNLFVENSAKINHNIY